MQTGQARIVVVDDDESMSKAIGRIVQAGGFKAQSFQSAEAVLECDSARVADCLILDITLPGISGFDLYRRLLRSGVEVPVIFVTARDEPMVRAEAQRFGRKTQFIPKPFSGRTLLTAIIRVLDHDAGWCAERQE